MTHSLSILTLRATLAYWRRNLLVWRKLAIPSLLGNFLDPLFYLFALGLGFSALLSPSAHPSYLHYLAPGIILYAALNATTFEALYSAFARMHVQKTWEGLLYGPVSLAAIVAGELLWASTKGVIAGGAVALVAAATGLFPLSAFPPLLPLLAAFTLLFAALALPMVAWARNYDFFLYYFTLFITPLSLLSGIFYPTDLLPPALALPIHYLPLAPFVALTHALAAQSPLPTDALLRILLYLLVLFPLCLLYAYRRLHQRLLP
ncbi:MAG: ABC transporter permease [Hydrogenophilus sp.]|nr:ABC transporter permease [Hydrogenophilus sp.]